jgi:Lycopene cyclase
VWLIWASAFLLPWIALFVAWPMLRRPMLRASALTAPFGLTEFLFVPRYWNPPSLFDLAHRTGFDIESLILCFAIGGLATAGYRVLVPASEHILAPQVRSSHLHRWHRAALVSPFFVFAALLMLPWNPIYPGIAALFVGALASGLCRPDLWRNMLVGGAVFLALYAVFLLGLKWLWPGYIEAVWNLGHLIAWRPAGLPLEELVFGFGFGMYWSSVYEHVAWRARDVLPQRTVTANEKYAR